MPVDIVVADVEEEKVSEMIVEVKNNITTQSGATHRCN